MFTLFQSLVLRVKEICTEHQHVTPPMKADLLAAVQNFYLDVAQRLRDQITLLLGDLPAEAKSEGASPNNFDRLIHRLVELCVEGRAIDTAFVIQVEGAITSFNAHLCKGLHKSVTLLLVPATPHPELLQIAPAVPPPVEPPPLELPDHTEEPTTDPSPHRQLPDEAGDEPELPTDPGSPVLGEVDSDLEMPADPEADAEDGLDNIAAATPISGAGQSAGQHVLIGDMVDSVLGPNLPGSTEDSDGSLPEPPAPTDFMTQQMVRQVMLVQGSDGDMVVRRSAHPAPPTTPIPPLTQGVEDQTRKPERARAVTERSLAPVSQHPIFTPMDPKKVGQPEASGMYDVRALQREMEGPRTGHQTVINPEEVRALVDQQARREAASKPEDHVAQYPVFPGPTASESGTMTWVATPDHPQLETTMMIPAKASTPDQEQASRPKEASGEILSGAAPQGRAARHTKVIVAPKVPVSPDSVHVDEHATLQPGWRNPRHPDGDEADFHTVIAPIGELMAEPGKEPQALDPRLIRVQTDPKKPDGKKK